MTLMKARTIALVVAALALSLVATAQEDKKPDPEFVLRSLTIVGEDSGDQIEPLPKIGVQPSLASNIEDVTIHGVVRRDLDLSGEFEVIPDSDAPEGLYLADTPVDVEAWKKKDAVAVVKVTGKKLASGKVELKGIAYLTDFGDKPVYDTRIEVDPGDVRFSSHRIADDLIGALTGTPGGFYSQMTFVYGVGKQRRVYVIDADGHNPRAISPEDQLAFGPTFGPDHQLYYSASVRSGAFKVRRPGEAKPLDIKPRGSVYGLAWNRDKSELAISIAQGEDITLFRGADFASLKVASKVEMAILPAWSPTGKLAFTGSGKWGPQIFVDGKAASPAGLPASAPTFCRHPKGIRLVYMAGWGDTSEILATGESGGGSVRLTSGKGENKYPACSPDGRLVAFFSTRKSGEGPGLYVMRVDGRRPKRVSSLVGSQLAWARLPEPQKGAPATPKEPATADAKAKGP
jgi:TolB protein